MLGFLMVLSTACSQGSKAVSGTLSGFCHSGGIWIKSVCELGIESGQPQDV